ncbi:AAA family ATPase [Streptomyces sp. NPDC047000]|uniref:AAA family ATPase n=1 Tax=Streptomyces sp. NPDC047000 TaxID=3155474 RepID=UPI0033C9C1AF
MAHHTGAMPARPHRTNRTSADDEPAGDLAPEDELVEREEAVGVLTGLIDRAARGQGGLALVSGAAGRGKTALLRRALRHARAAGHVVLDAAAWSFERELQLGVVRQLAARLPRPWAAGSARAVASDTPGVEFAHRLWSEMQHVTARRTVVIGVDDVHDADLASLRCLLYVARRADAARVAVILAEGDHPHSPLAELRGEFPGLRHYHAVELPPLSVAGVARLLTRRIGARRARLLAPHFHATTGGNPALVRAMAADLVAADIGAGPVVSPVLGGTVSAGTEFGGPGIAVRTERAAEGFGRMHSGMAVVAGIAHHTSASAAAESPVAAPVDEKIPHGSPAASFQHTVMGLVRRSWPGVLPAARALAVLGPAATTPLLSRLADCEERAVGHTLASLEALGLVTRGRFGHNATRSALLDCLPPGARADLHITAARLLREEGAEVTAVAEQLLAVGKGGGGQLLSLLEEVAEQAVVAGHTHLALACLRRAAEACPEPGRRARIVSRTMLLEWRSDPAAAARYLPALIEAQRRGELGGRHTAWLLRALLWNGCFDAVGEILGAHERAHRDGLPGELRLAGLWLGHSFPSLRGPLPPQRQAAVTALPKEQASALLVGVLAGAGHTEDVYLAERLLARSGNAGGGNECDSERESALVALQALLCLEQTSRAWDWSTRLAEADGADRFPLWHAMLTVIRAEAALRTGSLRIAESCAREALSDLGPESWGVAYCAPVAVLVAVLTEQGRFGEAAGLLDLPLHPGSLDSRFGLPYLHARGHHHLARGRPRAALDDFLACGELMSGWGIDHPGLVPWRSSVAQALLVLDDTAGAAGYATAQETLAAQLGASRSRALALRTNAATQSTERSLLSLTEAAELLQHCGDRLERARVLADLAAAYQAAGRPDRAGEARRSALALAGACAAAPLAARLGSPAATTGRTGTTAPAGRTVRAGKEVRSHRAGAFSRARVTGRPAGLVRRDAPVSEGRAVPGGAVAGGVALTDPGVRPGEGAKAGERARANRTARTGGSARAGRGARVDEADRPACGTRTGAAVPVTGAAGLGGAPVSGGSVRRAGSAAVTAADSAGTWLSPAELRTARLAAGGTPNREIARTLGITVSTVEQHLTRVYRKLGVRRRTQLARVLGPAAEK